MVYTQQLETKDQIHKQTARKASNYLFLLAHHALAHHAKQKSRCCCKQSHTFIIIGFCTSAISNQPENCTLFALAHRLVGPRVGHTKDQKHRCCCMAKQTLASHFFCHLGTRACGVHASQRNIHFFFAPWHTCLRGVHASQKNNHFFFAPCHTCLWCASQLEKHSLFFCTLAHVLVGGVHASQKNIHYFFAPWHTCLWCACQALEKQTLLQANTRLHLEHLSISDSHLLQPMHVFKGLPRLPRGLAVVKAASCFIFWATSSDLQKASIVLCVSCLYVCECAQVALFKRLKLVS